VNVSNFQEEAKVEVTLLNQYLKPLLGKRVEVDYLQSIDWFNKSGKERGWLVEKEGIYYLFKNRNSTKAKSVTFGLYDGFASTITIKPEGIRIV